jgi:SecD/SecF fusion protein
VVFDRMRENLRRYKTMPMRELVDLSINETMNRSIGTSMTLLLAALPLALFGGDTLSGFAWVMVAGIVISAASSVFIAAPIVLYAGKDRPRPSPPPADGAPAPSKRRPAAAASPVGG